MIAISDLIEFYQYFYRKRYGSSKYIFKPSDDANRLMKNFIKLIAEVYSIQSIGHRWLWNYFIFQYQYYDGLEIQERKNFSDKVVPNWIFGQKAFSRYLSRNQEFDYQIANSEVITKYKLSSESLIQRIEKRTPFDSEKLYKSRFLNTERGFAICVEYTTLYKPTDTCCIVCIHKNSCKKLLEANYPELYKQRTK